jgi:hypothetical protein
VIARTQFALTLPNRIGMAMIKHFEFAGLVALLSGEMLHGSCRLMQNHAEVTHG